MLILADVLGVAYGYLNSAKASCRKNSSNFPVYFITYEV